MFSNNYKLAAIVLFAGIFGYINIFTAAPAVTGMTFDDAATIYKAKCAACHSPAAAKFYDPAAPEADQIQAILHGKKGDKPPYMPAFSEKGITEDDARALMLYMKDLRKPN